MKNAFSVLVLLLSTLGIQAQTKFFDGTWKEAFEKAQKENKYLFVDCYTDWCVWCKVADKKTFPNEQVADLLNNDFISVKVDMERGDGVALGMRYRVLGYPTYLMFTPEGALAGKITGYIEDPNEFAGKVKTCFDADQRPAYPSSIADKIEFPDFYVNSFANKDLDQKRKDPEEGAVETWLSKQTDMKSEVAWSVMYRFPLPESVEQQFLANRNDFAHIYGHSEVDEKISGIGYGRLQKAIDSKDQAELGKVVDFVDKYVDDDREKRKEAYRLKFYEETGNWKEYVHSVKTLTNLYGFKNFLTDLNNYGWSIYLHSEDKEAITEALDWMLKVVETDPQYMYLDTYAALLYKAGDFDSALKWAEKAISVGNDAGEKVQETEQLRDEILKAKAGK